MGVNKSGVCGVMYSVVDYPTMSFIDEVWITVSADQKAKEISININYVPKFPNPFDAYFYLLENFKEEEIV